MQKKGESSSFLTLFMRPSYLSFSCIFLRMAKGALLCFFFFFFFFNNVSIAMASPKEGPILQRLGESLGVKKTLIFPNWTGTDPCVQKWQGVVCTGTYVTKLVLDSLSLAGSLPENTLSLLQLRILSLSNNNISGLLPSDLVTCTQLRTLYLHNNSFHGPIPSPLSGRLKKIYLAGNLLSGNIPPSFSTLPFLLSLHLENNQLAGKIPAFYQTTLSDLNLSNNRLAGQIPATPVMQKFGPAAFAGNALLCGPPLPACGGTKKFAGRLSMPAIVGIVMGDACLLLVITCLCVYYRNSKYRRNNDMPSAGKVVPADGFSDSGSAAGDLYGDDDVPKLILFDDHHAFKLEDLLRSSAEFLGEGSLGHVYKAIMHNGTIVAVKRVKNGNDHKQLGEEIEIVGRLRHQNVVPLWAYYHAKDENLLVYEYQPNGSLMSLLHGSLKTINPTQKPLSWNARLRIARGIAQGLAYIHHECGTMAHGNIKASNILINNGFEACIADFGLVTFFPSSSSSSSSSSNSGYTAPEYRHTKKISQSGDVYSFGVLLLELLTGKMAQHSKETTPNISLPQWVNSAVRQEWTTEVFDPKLSSSKMSEESMVSMLQIAISCVANSPEQRPTMSEVANMIEDIKEEEYISPTNNYDHSMNMQGSEIPSSQFSFF